MRQRDREESCQPSDRVGAAALSVMLASNFAALAQMSLPGSFSVGPTGAASYGIPIAVQDYPFTGLTASQIRTIPSGSSTQTPSQATSTYQFSNASSAATVSAPSGSSAPYRVSVSQSVASSSDLDSSALPTVTTTFRYDSFGNPTQVVASTPDGASKTTTNTYTNDATNWFLGRLTGASVTSTLP
jgi:hypothetical protein